MIEYVIHNISAFNTMSCLSYPCRHHLYEPHVCAYMDSYLCNRLLLSSNFQVDSCNCNRRLAPQIFDRIKAQVLYRFHSKLAVEFSNCLVTALGALLKFSFQLRSCLLSGFCGFREFRSSSWRRTPPER